MTETLFADVIVPLSVPNTFTYRVPAKLNDDVAIGKRVIVQFGRNKLYSAIVVKIHRQPPLKYEAKYVEAVIDQFPVVTPRQLELWDWMSLYYMANIGDVMNVALPAALKLDSETKVVLNTETVVTEELLSDQEYLIYEALQVKGELTLEDIMKILGKKSIHTQIKSLIEKEVIALVEELAERYKPKIDQYIALTAEYDDESKLELLFSELAKHPKQEQLLISYVFLTSRYQQKKEMILKKELLEKAQVTDSVIKTLIKKGVFTLIQKEKGRIANENIEATKKQLSEKQREIFVHLQQSEKRVHLLHGITGSGKTEIYIHLIEEEIKKGKQVLYLLPEIALTAQIINRLKNAFGDEVGVYHSRYSTNARAEVWNNLLQNGSNRYKIIVGARSALFLPVQDLGLIIIDEEHDNSFKQQDPSPRYHGRDTALYLAHLHKATTLLGSATPSLETLQNVKEGKYGYYLLEERFNKAVLPEIVLADLKKGQIEKTNRSMFSELLCNQIFQALEKKEQVILFQNRRGYSAYIECADCATVIKCKSCDVSLTYHKSTNQLKCHYCGFHSYIPKSCEGCGSEHLKQMGFGTEKIEDELALLFPEAKIARMDLDTTRSRANYYKLINDFEDGLIDILVGTQMVTKGLDFSNVTLVGVLNADQMLNYPDFRSHERGLQTLMQVSGRAGRKDKPGRVVIQTNFVGNPIFARLSPTGLKEFYEEELIQRKEFNYPPFTRLIEITIKHKTRENLEVAAQILGIQLRTVFGERIIGPEFPMIDRIRDYYLMQILVKCEKKISISQLKLNLKDQLSYCKTLPEFKSVLISLDVDPY